MSTFVIGGAIIIAVVILGMMGRAQTNQAALEEQYAPSQYDDSSPVTPEGPSEYEVLRDDIRALEKVVYETR